MNNLEKQMVSLLKDLKENYSVVGVKAEFEAEGTRLNELMRLKEICDNASLGLTLKIGGCEAMRDLYDAQLIGVECIVAPMVETAFALRKFIVAIDKALPEDVRQSTEFAINVETIQTYRNLDEMLDLSVANRLSSMTLGRVDFTGSMGLTRDDINGEEIFKIANDMFRKIRDKNIRRNMGGGISQDTIGFLKRLEPGLLNRFETRKIIFQLPEVLENIEKAIEKSVRFEHLWLKNKSEHYQNIADEDKSRLAMIERRIQQFDDKTV